jgi:hypothetical protein
LDVFDFMVMEGRFGEELAFDGVVLVLASVLLLSFWVEGVCM